MVVILNKLLKPLTLSPSPWGCVKMNIFEQVTSKLIIDQFIEENKVGFGGWLFFYLGLISENKVFEERNLIFVCQT